jgi:predicted GNAT family N-acyltransferase
MNAVATLPGLAPVYEATTAGELEQLWEFRHRVYVEELGRELGRDDGDRSWVHDTEDDQSYTLHLFTRDDDGVTGVLRIRHWQPGAVPARDFDVFTMERFPEIERLTTAELGRLMVRKSERGRLLLASLLSAAYELGCGRLGVDLAFLNCATGLVRHYRRLGARPYNGRLVATPDGIEIPMVIVLSDLAAFEQAGSFLLPIAERFFGPGGRPTLDVPRFAHLFEAKAMPFELDPSEAWRRFEERLPAGRTASFVEALSRETKERLSSEGMLLSVPAGELLTAKGLTQRELFVIADGVFEVVDGDRRLRLLGEGDVIGETAFFSSAGRRTASVRAASDGRVVVLRRGDVDRMRQTDPACAAELLFELARVQADRADTWV